MGTGRERSKRAQMFDRSSITFLLIRPKTSFVSACLASIESITREGKRLYIWSFLSCLMLSWDSDSDNEPAHQPLKKAKIIGYGCIQATTSLGQSVELPRKQSAALHSRTSNIKSHQLYQAARTDLEKHLLPEITDNTPASDDASNGSLWVTKYQPKSFTDLVGDQRLFRNILSWVKNWDFAVFKRPVKSRYVPFYQMGQGFVSKYKDALDRPEKRIVLLAGPPGIGKTTLVHVIAQHCGYSILEINASDDRTSESIKGKLASLESTRIDDKRPVLLLIDEIDGAHANQDAFISIIIKTSLTCKRPIICVCNDPYVPALKLLRPACHVFHVKPLEYKILADRLIDICEWEGICISI